MYASIGKTVRVKLSMKNWILESFLSFVAMRLGADLCLTNSSSLESDSVIPLCWRMLGQFLIVSVLTVGYVQGGQMKDRNWTSNSKSLCPPPGRCVVDDSDNTCLLTTDALRMLMIRQWNGLCSENKSCTDKLGAITVKHLRTQ